MGIAPTERMTVTLEGQTIKFEFNNGGNLTGIVVEPNDKPGRNTMLPIGDGMNNNKWNPSPTAVSTRPCAGNNCGKKNDNLKDLIGILKQWASNPDVDPTVPPGTNDVYEIFLGSSTDANAIFPKNDVSWHPGYFQGLDAVIRARSTTDEPLVILTGGVNLTDHTSLTITKTEATSLFFEGLLKEGEDLDGAVASILGRNFDVVWEDSNGDGVPETISVLEDTVVSQDVRVLLLDRILGVVGGSSISPDSDTTKTALLAILDSDVTGPSSPPHYIPGDKTPSGSDPGYDDITRADVPAIIEVIGDLNTGEKSTTESTYGIVVKAELDSALLQASAPLIRVIQGSITTTSDLVLVDGSNAILTVNIPNDQLVLQGAIEINNATMNVGGNVFNITNVASASITGNLVAIGNNSTLTVGGSLIAVGPGSIFTLTGGSLIAFGIGTNTVTFTGTAGGCGGCTLTSTVPNLLGIPVLLHHTATVTVGNGFVPYSGISQGIVNNVDYNNTINVEPGAAVLQVDAGGTLTLNP